MTEHRVDLSSDPFASSSETPSHGVQRRFVGIHYACCDVYARVYVNQTETAYEGRCPKCLRLVRLGIGPDGTNQRFFTAY